MASTYIPRLPEGVPLRNVVAPTNIDVLCGRDAYVQRHAGNQSYRKLVNANKEAYTTCKKTDKLRISRCIVAAVREKGGRFLEKPKGETTWSDIGDKKAVEKTSQALREGQPKLRRQMVENEASSATTNETLTFTFIRTPEFEVVSSTNTTVTTTARISMGTPLETIAASPVVDRRPSVDTGNDPFQQFDAAIEGSTLFSQGESDHAPYSYSSPSQQPYHDYPEASNNIYPISEDNPYQYHHHQQWMDEPGPSEMVDPPYAMESAALSHTQMPAAFPLQAPANEMHRQVTHPHDNYSSRDHHLFQPCELDPPPMDPLGPQQNDLIERQQQEYYMSQQQQEQQIFQFQPDTEKFGLPGRSHSSDSMSSSSSIGPGCIPNDWVAATTTSTMGNRFSLLPPSRKLDRRRIFAKMKGSQLSSARLSEESRRSIDGMPDIHMLDSSLSLLSIGSNNNHRMGTLAAATATHAMDTTERVSKDDFYVTPWIGSSRRSITSSGRLSFTTRSRDDLYTAMESRRSLMSGLSNISGAADYNFSDMGRKFGSNRSNRSAAMSEISYFEEGNLEGLTDWELKSSDELPAI